MSMFQIVVHWHIQFTILIHYNHGLLEEEVFFFQGSVLQHISYFRPFPSQVFIVFVYNSLYFNRYDTRADLYMIFRDPAKPRRAPSWPITTCARAGKLAWFALILSELVPSIKSNRIVPRPEFPSMGGECAHKISDIPAKKNHIRTSKFELDF